MTLFVHRATSTDALAAGLADLLRDPLADPFAEQVVAVPAKGVERWLAQQLSHHLGASGPGTHDGVCAGVRFLSPHSLVALVLGIEVGDPWHADQLAWPVLRAIDDSLDEPWAHPLAQHLGRGVPGIEGELRRGRRYAVARRLAGLFSDYAAQRPAMLADWRTGGSGDGLGSQVAADLAWQPELWRRVLDVVGNGDAGAEAPEQRQTRVVAALRAGDLDGLDLPGRLSLFGHTRIARSEIEVVEALAEHRDVHLWLPQASPTAWDRLAEVTASGPVPRDEDGSGPRVRHHLLASLGRDSRELQRTLALAPATDVPLHRAATLSEPTSLPRLLQLLQGDIASDHAPDEADRARRMIGETDRSIQVHACHGAARQIEVLRDVITDLLEQDPTLEPRDILVMCPDIETWSPLVHAAFGLHESSAHPAHGFRVRIADRAPLHTNPLLALADRLVVLAGGRLTASEVLDLARAAPVRRRFGFADDDLERLTDWVDAVAIRWGLDADHRESYLLRDLTQNTWRAGLDRILVGAAVDGDVVDHVGTTLALDDLDSGDIELAGRLAELIARLASALDAMRESSTASKWVEVLGKGVHDLAEVPVKDTWQVAQLDHELARMRTAAEDAGGARLGLADIHALLVGRGAARATRSSFRTGTLTVCTMVPMRSVPHRVVCLVGLDDGTFPRSSIPDGDDVLARRPVTGERDARSEDRQLLLDALMSAGESVVITYAGFDEHTGQPRPPAVPLGEVIEAVHQTATGLGVERLVTEHPLQSFDARNLGVAGDRPPLLAGDRPFSYDPTALEAARCALGQRTQRQRPVDILLSPPPAGDIDLVELTRFFDNPARAYLRERLGMLLPEVEEQRHEGIPIELDGLGTWAIGERMLQAVLAGRDLEATCDAELWRGQLPPGELGYRTLREVALEIQGITRVAWRVAGVGAPRQPMPREVLDLDLALPSGRRLTGTVPGIVSGRALTITYSNIRAKQRLRSWITSLALSAAGTAHTSDVVGRSRRGRRRGQVHVQHGPHDPQSALCLLDDLVDLRDRGLREPIPLPLATSYAWASGYLGNQSEWRALELAGREWVSDGGRDKPFLREQHETAHQFVYGGIAALGDILGEPGADEWWQPGVTSRLGQLALRVWGPVLNGAEEMTHS